MKRPLLKHNADEVIKIILRYYGKKNDKFDLYLYHQHPLFPSYQAISYILAKKGIDSILIETDYSELRDLPKPFIINYDGLFIPIIEMNKGGEIIFVNERGDTERMTLTFLAHKWDKTVLILNSQNDELMAESPTKKKWYYRAISKRIVMVFCVTFLIYTLFLQIKKITLFGGLFLLTTIAGIIVSILFHIRQIDRKNPYVNKLCHSHRNIRADCSSILDSEDAYLFGVVSWVDVGSFYFIYIYMLLTFAHPESVVTFLSILSIVTSIYIPYSIFYQWRVARSWCPLCLRIQGILFLNLMFSILLLIHNQLNFSALQGYWREMFCIALFVFIGYFSFIRILYSHLALSSDKRVLNQIKHCYEGRQLLIYSKPFIDEKTIIKKDLIVREGKDKLTMVVNPTCSPCMHKLYDVLLVLDGKRDVDFSLIFLIDSKDQKSLRLANRMFNMSPYDIFNYAKAFPKSKNMIEANTTNCAEDYSSTIKEQSKWCMQNKIFSTPQIILNGYILDNVYKVTDLDYLVE